jgi:arsenite methyltransferase
MACWTWPDIGYANVEFRKGRIQDLGLDLERLQADLTDNPIADANSFLAAQERADDLRVKYPLVANDSIDVVVSNCVLNLVGGREKGQLFEELFRVLRNGGRAVISDIVSDEDIPEDMADDPILWSGCISGAYREDTFLKAFEDAGFCGIRILKRDTDPWQTVQGIEFRSVTVEAFKGNQGQSLERNQAVIYKGPFRKVLDDDGHAMERGQRYAVCDNTYKLYQQAPYADDFEFIEPREAIPLADAQPYECREGELRHPRESKGLAYDATTEASSCETGETGDCC